MEQERTIIIREHLSEHPETAELMSRSVRLSTVSRDAAIPLEELIAAVETSLPRKPSSLPPQFIVDNVAGILERCRKANNPSYVSRMYACMQESGLDSHQSLGNHLVSLLIDAGRVQTAQKVFYKLPSRSEFSWTSLINGHVKFGKPQQALVLYREMLDDSVQPSGYTFVALLKACLKSQDVNSAHQLHADISKRGLDRDLFVGSALVDMFAKFDMMEKAQEVFDRLATKDAMPWNAMISGYTRQGHGQLALDFYERMQAQGVVPNVITFVCMLKACGTMGAIDDGREIHFEASRRGFDKDRVVGNALIDMYGTCGLPAKAQDVFNKLPVQDIISWTSLISGYVKHGFGLEAVSCFQRMKQQGFTPDVITLVCSLKACGMAKSIEVGENIHTEIARDGSLENNPFVANALVDMYAKCGVLEKAQEVFEKLKSRDAMTWNSLIAGYCKQGLGEQALARFEQMCSEGICPDAVTLSCIVKACGNLGAVAKAGEVHSKILEEGMQKESLIMGNGLIDMYAKCGLLCKAQEMFDNLQLRDVVSWNSLLAGYAQLGESEKVFSAFDRMLMEEEKPNAVTFGSILNACIHCGLMWEGQRYYHFMIREIKTLPTTELYNCVIDLFGRAGQLGGAAMIANGMPVQPTLVVWNTLLGACRKWGNIKLAKHSFYEAIGLEQGDPASYVGMYNVYADADMVKEAKMIEVMGMVNKAWDSTKRICWIEAS